jgi:hypothetical protein
MFLVLSMYNNLNISNELDISTILTMYIALVVVFTLIHSLDLKKRFIEITEINSKYRICYHYFQSEADSSLLEFGATKKNIYFDYAKKLAESITGSEDTPVYFSSNYVDVPTTGLSSSQVSPSLIGELSQEDIYINSGAKKDGSQTINLWLAR